MTESQHHYQRVSGSEPLSSRAGDEEFVEFVRAGEGAVGEFECVACGERAVVHGDLSPCATCAGTLWERSSWSPFANVLAGLRSRVD